MLPPVDVRVCCPGGGGVGVGVGVGTDVGVGVEAGCVVPALVPVSGVAESTGSTRFGHVFAMLAEGPSGRRVEEWLAAPAPPPRGRVRIEFGDAPAGAGVERSPPLNATAATAATAAAT